MDTAIRMFDDLGRVAIPKDIRKALQIHYGDVAEVYVVDNLIVVRPIKSKENEDEE